MERLSLLLEKALNRYLALDGESSTHLEKLEGKHITIELLGFGLIFQLSFLAKYITIKYSDLVTPDAYIKGTPLTLLHMTLTQGDRKHFFAEDVSIEGDLEVGQQVIALFDQLEIDWEEYLSHWLGDTAAHQVGRFVHSVKDFGKRLNETLIQNVNEYMHEEINLCPPREELQDFFADIDQIRMDVDRLDARVERLKKMNQQRGVE